MSLLRSSALAGLAASLVLAATGSAQNPPGPPPVPAPAAEETVQLPKMTVNSARFEDYPPISGKDLSGGGLAPSEPPVSLFFPGKAYSDAIPKGYATVCVELDEKGNATDYLLVAYTEKYFGEALLRNAKDTRYSPLVFKGVAVPSRFNFGYEFRPQFTVAMNSFNAMEHRLLEVAGGEPEFKYHPVTEAALDNRLEPLRQALPYFPDGYVRAGGKADRVMVTLYIDEQGHVRVPRVDSAASPLLVKNALKAVHYWQFKPPTVKGQPALVYAAFAVNFIPVGG